MLEFAVLLLLILVKEIEVYALEFLGLVICFDVVVAEYKKEMLVEQVVEDYDVGIEDLSVKNSLFGDEKVDIFFLASFVH